MVSSITTDGKSIPKKSKSRRTSRSKSSGSSSSSTLPTTSTTTKTTSLPTNRNNNVAKSHSNNNPSLTATTTKTSSNTTSPTTNSTTTTSQPSSSSSTTTTTATMSTKTKSKTTSNASTSLTTTSSSHLYRKHGGISSSSSNNNMVLVADRKRGVYECDYCRVDISQACRIRCAVCPDFDLCLDCFATTDPNAAGTIRAAAKAAILLQQETDDGNPTSNTTNATTTTPSTNTTFAAIHHEPSHGYRVCDSTKFPLFPSLRGVEPKNINNNDVEPNNNNDKQQGTTSKVNNVKQGDKEEVKDVKMENALKEKIEKNKIDTTNDTTPNTEKKDEKNKQTSTTKEETDKSRKKVKNETMDDENKKSLKTSQKDEIKTEEENRKKKKKKRDFTPMIVIDDPKTAWTAEEDLRLLDAISTYGLGNWADIAEAMYSNNNNVSAGGTSTVNMNKYAKRCMERYLDDFLGTYGHIVPPYTLVQDSTANFNNNGHNSKLLPPPSKKTNDDNSNDNTPTEPLDSKKIKEDSSSGDRKRKRSKSSPFVSYPSSSSSSTTINNTGSNSNTSTKGMATLQPKKYKVVPTSTLHGFKHIWPDPYILPNHKIGEDVGRDLAARAEQTYVKLSNNCNSKKEFEELEKEWKSERLNKPGGPTALPPRLVDIQSLEGSELAGFMPRRGDFDMEWENDAEIILADMEFSEHDPPQDVALKLQIISIYNEKLNDREKRKAFLTERHLLDYRKNQARDQALPPEDRDLIHRMRLFARFHKSSEEHDKFIEKLLKAKRLRKEIATFQMYRKLGITSLAEAERFELDKSRREHHKHAHQQKEMELEEKAKKAAAAAASAVASSATDGIEAPSSSALLSGPKLWKEYYTPRMTERKNRKSINRGTSDTRTTTIKNESNNSVAEGKDKMKNDDTNVDSGKVDSKETLEDKKKEDVIPMEVESSTPCTVNSKSPGYDLLSSSEIGLCNRLSILPKQYLEAKKELIRQSITQGLLEGENKNSFFKIDVEKRDSIVEFVMTAGWISSKPMKKQPTIVSSKSTPTTTP